MNMNMLNYLSYRQSLTVFDTWFAGIFNGVIEIFSQLEVSAKYKIRR